MASTRYTSLVLDVGGVLAFYSPRTDVAGLSPHRIKNALDSPGWHDYERGKVSQQECYDTVTSTFDIDPESWEKALEQMKREVRPNAELIGAIRRLRESHPSLRVYCLSNMPRPESERFRCLIEGWGIIDGFYPSSAAGHRKPDAAAFQGFLDKSGSAAEACIFVDDGVENVVAAQALGFRVVLFRDTDEAIRTLHNLLGDPVARGMAYLKSQAQSFVCETTAGEVQTDNYSQLLILQNTGDRSLVSLHHTGLSWNYFTKPSGNDDANYPDDADTTSLAMTVLDDVPAEDKEAAMEQILLNRSPDGLPYCWFDRNRPRFCHCICANVFRFFCLNNRSDELPSVYDYLCRLLRTDAYLLGSRYYPGPDWFLYILADLCARRPREPGLQEMCHLVASRVQERAGCDTNVLGATLRLLNAQALGMESRRDLDTVLDSQQLDGGWERTWMWTYGKEPKEVGGRGVVTAMAVNGIRKAREATARILNVVHAQGNEKLQ